jgi:hypothetical protein
MLTRSRVTGASEYPTGFYGFHDRGISILLHDGAQGVPVHEHYSFAAEVRFPADRGYRTTFAHCGPHADQPGRYRERKVPLDNGSWEYQVSEQLPDGRSTKYHYIARPEQIDAVGDERIFDGLRWDYAHWREAND